MDFLPDSEFHPVFDRTTKKVNLQGCATAEEINARLIQKINEYKILYGTNPLAQLQVESKTAGLRTLVAAGFGRRAISEAIANPTGRIALTLKYGRDKALRILAKRRGL